MGARTTQAALPLFRTTRRVRVWVRPRVVAAAAILAAALILLLLLARGRLAEGAAASEVDWSQFAYAAYAPDGAHLCSALMMFERLHALGSRADRVLLYAKAGQEEGVLAGGGREARLLHWAEAAFGAQLVPVEAGDNDAPAPSASSAGLLALGQTSYSRVIALDSASTLLRPLDHLFLRPLRPSVPVAMARSQWHAGGGLAPPPLMLVAPSAAERDRVVRSGAGGGGGGGGGAESELQLVRRLYGSRAGILPEEGALGLLPVSELRRGAAAAAAAMRALETANVLLFSDPGPVPAPWIAMAETEREAYQPSCADRDDCAARTLWNGIYDDFARRREAICGSRYEGESGESDKEEEDSIIL